MAQCKVHGCTSPSVQRFVPHHLDVTLEFPVCEAHALELKVSPYTLTDDSEILIGSSAPPGIVNLMIKRTIARDAEVTLVLGRDGIEESRVQFLMSPEEARDLCNWVAHSDHREVET